MGKNLRRPHFQPLMHLTTKIKAVTRIFRELEIQSTKFKDKSGMACIQNCSLCCTNPKVSATVLEFLPAAYELFISSNSEQILEKLELKTDSVCIFHSPFQTGGGCSNYINRGLICRLFGNSGRIKKHGDKIFLSCVPLKGSIHPDKLNNFLQIMPEMQAWYMRLYGIDPALSVEYLPINEAIKKALEIIIFHFQFRKKRA
jgi:uncharacterized protein